MPPRYAPPPTPRHMALAPRRTPPPRSSAPPAVHSPAVRPAPAALPPKDATPPPPVTSVVADEIEEGRTPSMISTCNLSLVRSKAAPSLAPCEKQKIENANSEVSQNIVNLQLKISTLQKIENASSEVIQNIVNLQLKFFRLKAK